MSVFLGILLCCQDIFSQDIYLKSSGNDADVYETVSLDSYKSKIDENIEMTAALRYFLMQEIANDSEIYDISRSVVDGEEVFIITTKTGLSVSEVESKINASLVNANTTLRGYAQQNDFTPNELSNFIKSELINYN